MQTTRTTASRVTVPLLSDGQLVDAISVEGRLQPPLHTRRRTHTNDNHMKRKHQKLAILLAMVGAGVFVAARTRVLDVERHRTAASTTVANPDPVTLSPGELTDVGFLYPGTSTKVSVKISNPNPFPVTVPSLVLDTTEGYNDSGLRLGPVGLRR